MDNRMKFLSKQCDPGIDTVKKQEYQVDLTVIDVFAGAFASFFMPKQKQEEGDGSAGRIMKKIVAELPAVLQFRDEKTEKTEREKVFSEVIADPKMPDWHKLSLGLADAYHMPREAALAIMMPAWCKFMLRSQAGKLADFAKQVWDVSGQELSECSVAQEGIARFQAFICQCGLAVTLREYGIRNFDSRRMAEQIIRNYGEGQNDIRLELTDIQSIYELAKG